MLLKLGNLICAHVDFVKFIYQTLDICSQQKNNDDNNNNNNNNNDNNNNNNNNDNNNAYTYTKIHICTGTSEYQNIIIVFPICLTL